MAKHKFSATLEIIGVNPYVHVPPSILADIFSEAGKDKGGIPVCGQVNGKPYKQTLVKYRGSWRLYINTMMLKNSPQHIGESIEVDIEFDPESREIAMPEPFRVALDSCSEAKAVFESLSPSRKLEIVRYLARLKSEDSLQRNIQRAINFLLGKERFIGRDKP
ncbi:MAG: YdeI/OmpD-associated family protein [Chloroflexota bacterium]